MEDITRKEVQKMNNSLWSQETAESRWQQLFAGKESVKILFKLSDRNCQIAIVRSVLTWGLDQETKFEYFHKNNKG